MIDSNSSHSDIKHRIVIFSKVFGTFISLCGIILVIVQVVKSFREGWTGSNILTTLLGAILVILGNQSVLTHIVTETLRTSHRKTLKLVLFLSPFILTGLLLYIKFQLGHDSRSWQRMNSEGGIPEYATSIFYLLASFFSYQISKTFRQKNDSLLAWIYLLLTLLFVFIGLEEISWGQRLIGFKTPEYFEKHNFQSEFTFHNLSFFHENLLHQSYILISFLGSFSWLILSKTKHNFLSVKLRKYLIPSWYLASFFLPTLIFYLIHEYSNGFGFFIVEDQESFEFLLSLGFLLFIIGNYFKQGMTLKQEKKEYAVFPH